MRAIASEAGSALTAGCHALASPCRLRQPSPFLGCSRRVLPEEAGVLFPRLIGQRPAQAVTRPEADDGGDSFNSPYVGVLFHDCPNLNPSSMRLAPGGEPTSSVLANLPVDAQAVASATLGQD